MDLEKVLSKMREEVKAFCHYSFMNDKQRKNYLFYHLCMNSYLLTGSKYDRRNALHYLWNYKKVGVLNNG